MCQIKEVYGMKTAFSRTLKAPWQLIVRGVVLSILATAVLVILFALLISLLDLSDSVIHTVNQLIKIISIGVGVCATVFPGSDKGLLRGALVGLIYMAAGVIVYALLTHQELTASAYLADLLMGVAAGGLIGLLRAKAV